MLVCSIVKLLPLGTVDDLMHYCTLIWRRVRVAWLHFFLKQINFIGLKSSNRTATSHMYRVTCTQERSHNSLQIVSDVKRKAKMYATPQGGTPSS